jgi:thymidylate synthase
MNNLDKQYTDLLQDILYNGVEKKDRTGTGTISVFGRQIRHDMKDGFPLLTTKKMPFKTIVTELLWFLRGDTNIKFLVDNNCHIWDGDCYQAYLKSREKTQKDYKEKWGDDISNNPLSQEEFIDKIKTDDEFAKKWGDLGKIYGFQWRNWGGWKDTKQTGFLHKTDNGWSVKWSDLHSFANGTEWLTTPILYSDQSFYSDEDEGKKVYYKNITLGYNESFCPVQVAKVIDDKFDKYVGGIDQIANSINLLKTDPDSRRNRVNAWNVGELDQMVLPPCHTDFQFFTRELSLDERAKLHPTPDMFYDINGTFSIQDSIEDSNLPTEDKVWLHSKFDEGGIPKRAISLMWNQRSVDTFLGLPFNIASYGLLLEIIAKSVNMIPDQLIGNLGDVHLYSNHIEQAREQIGKELTIEERINIASSDIHFDPGDFGIGEHVSDESMHATCDLYGAPRRTRQPYELPKLNINTEFWPYEGGECGEGPLDAKAVFEGFKNEHFCKCLLEEDIQLYDYNSHSSIKAPLSN